MHLIAHSRVPSRQIFAGSLSLAAVLLVLAIAPAISQAACSNPVACENQLPGTPESHWQVDRDGRSHDPGLRDVDERQRGRDGLVQDQVADARTTTSTSSPRLLRRQRRADDRLGNLDARPRRDPAGLPRRRQHRADRLRQLGRLGVLDRAERRGVRASTSPTSCATTPAATARSCSSCATTRATPTSSSRPPTRPGRPTTPTAATASTRARSPARPASPGVQGRLKVSYNRPFDTARTTAAARALFTSAEYPMIRFLERNGYDVSYISGVDVDATAALLHNHKLVHLERPRRVLVRRRSARTWRPRATPASTSPSSAATRCSGRRAGSPAPTARARPNRTLVSYKDTHFDARRPDPVEWTGTWRDPRFSPPADGGHAGERAHRPVLRRQLRHLGDQGARTPYAKLRFWRNTAVATLTAGPDADARARTTLGYEWDDDADNGFRPAGPFNLSSTTVSGVEVFTDYGSTTQSTADGDAQPDAVPAPSGARVFGAGTVQWAWGLDDWNHDGTRPTATCSRRRSTCSPTWARSRTTLLVRPGRPRRRRPTPPRRPRPSARRPATRRRRRAGDVSGTATDTGGGVVAGVEVSTDGGTTWHPATGTTSWTYTWIAHGTPVDDDQGARDRRQRQPRTPRAPARRSPSTARARSGARASRPAGRRRGRHRRRSRSASSSSPTVRHGQRHPLLQGDHQHRHPRRQPVDGGRHSASPRPRSAARARPAGRRSTFASPVAVKPNTTYVASYFAPNGHYSATQDYFYRSPAPGPERRRIVDSPPLHALRNTGTTRQRRLRVQRDQHVPDQHATARPTTGSTCSSRPTAGARAR